MPKPFRCHDADACHAGQSPCTMPWACGIQSPSPRAVSFWKNMMDAFIAPTCCEVTDMDCTQGRNCPVHTGEYKPKEAIHQIQEPAK